MIDIMEVARPAQANMKELDGNVNCMKGWLIDNIGADWATATQPNRNSKLGIRSGNLPWNEVAAQRLKEVLSRCLLMLHGMYEPWHTHSMHLGDSKSSHKRSQCEIRN